MTHYQEIHKSKIEHQIQSRYGTAIKQLEALSFSELRFIREVVFPFSALLMFYLYPMMKMNREVFCIENPLRYVIMYPVLVNREFDSFSVIFGKGVVFSTGFTDGSLLISTSFPSHELIEAKRKLYRYAPKQDLSLEKTWEFHRSRIFDLERKERLTVADFSLDHFEELVQRNQKALLFRR